MHINSDELSARDSSDVKRNNDLNVPCIVGVASVLFRQSSANSLNCDCDLVNLTVLSYEFVNVTDHNETLYLVVVLQLVMVYTATTITV